MYSRFMHSFFAISCNNHLGDFIFIHRVLHFSLSFKLSRVTSAPMWWGIYQAYLKLVKGGFDDFTTNRVEFLWNRTWMIGTPIVVHLRTLAYFWWASNVDLFVIEKKSAKKKLKRKRWIQVKIIFSHFILIFEVRKLRHQFMTSTKKVYSYLFVTCATQWWPQVGLCSKIESCMQRQ